MAKLFQWRRGTTVEHLAFTGEEGEITVDTDKDTIVLHDGLLQGGFPMLREDVSNYDGTPFTTTVEVDKLRLTDHGGNSQMWTLEEDSSGSNTNALTFDYAGSERLRIAPNGLITSIGGAVFGDNVEVDQLILTDHGGNSQMWVIEEDSAVTTNAITFDYAGIERFRISPTGIIKGADASSETDPGRNLTLLGGTGDLAVGGTITVQGGTGGDSNDGGDVLIVPGVAGESGGPGSVVITGLTWPAVDGSAGQPITTDGSGNLGFGGDVEVDRLVLTDHGGNSQVWTIEEDSAVTTNAITFDYASVERLRIAPNGTMTFGVNGIIKGFDSSTETNPGGNLTVLGGSGDASVGGTITVQGGTGSDAGDGGDVLIVPGIAGESGGPGSVVITGLTWPAVDGSAGQFMKTDGAGNLSFASGGDPDQNLWLNINADTGTTNAESTTDTLIFAGGTGITTSITVDTVTISPVSKAPLQMIYGQTTTSVASSSNTYVSTTLSASITPLSATSTILIQVIIIIDDAGGSEAVQGRLLRNATPVHETLDGPGGIIPVTFLDSPATSSAITYSVEFRRGLFGAQSNPVTAQPSSALATIVLTEIKA